VLFTEANLQWLAAHVGLGGFGRAHFSLIDQMWASQRPALQRRLDEENQRGAEGRMRVACLRQPQVKPHPARRLVLL
jgi:hypothetical protein